MTTSRPVACIALELEPDLSARIATVADVRRPSGSSREATIAALAGAQGLLCSNHFLVDDALLAALPDLRVVSGFGVGYDEFDIAAATRHGVAICNTPGVLTAAVADLTIGLILAAARDVLANDAYVRSGSWTSGAAGRPGLGWDLGGKTLGLVGFGRIGQAVAGRARAFGMSVVFHDLFAAPPAGFDDCRAVSLPELLAASDVVSLHVNLSAETRHLIGAPELALMKPTAWLVNTSRGPVVDQPALTAALRSGAITGAALDVLQAEPPAATDPIVAFPNVIVLPHVGSATVETRRAMRELSVDNLIAVLAGTAPPACVNPEVLPRP